MKNLKKVLSLVLVVAMACSMMVFASAVDYTTFTDADKVSEQYIEAVDVITQLGIFVGDEGLLNPQGTFTRAQAAKIVTYMSIGNKAAESLNAMGGIFKDVPATHWASKYIAYAYNAGILSGDGDGNYRPEDPVKGSEVAKLMNTVLGYGKQGEYTGASWELNAISHGVSRGLITGDADLTAPALREEVIQYVFNTIRDNAGNNNRMVEYSNITGSYVWANASVNAVGTAGKTWIGPYIFGLFSNDRIDVVDGTPSHFWRQYNIEITGLYPNEDPVVVSTNGTGIQTAATGLLATNNLVMRTYYDAVAQTYTNYYSVYINGVLSTMTQAEVSAAKVGAKVSLYAHYNVDTGIREVYHIAIVEKSVAKVLAAPGYTYGVMSSIAGLPSPGFGCKYLGDTDIAKDDVVLYYTDGNGNIHLNKANYVEGQLTRYTPGMFNIARLDSIAFGGETYNLSGLDGTLLGITQRTLFTGTGVSSNFNADAVIYLDDFKNVVRFDLGAVIKNYIYAYDYSNDAFTGNTAVRAKMVKADGTPVIASIKTNAAQATIEYTEIPQWFTYVENEGVYTLTRITDGSAPSHLVNTTTTGTLNITAKYANFLSGTAYAGSALNNIYGDNTTIFIFLNSAKGTTKVFTGINSMVNATLVTGNRVAAVKASGTSNSAKYVVIQTTQDLVPIASLAYFTSATTPPSGTELGQTVFYNSNVILDGVLIDSTATVKTATAPVPGLYYVTKGDNDVYTVGAPAATATGYGIVATTGSVLTIGGALQGSTPADIGAISSTAAIYDLTNGPVRTDAAYMAGNTGMYYEYSYYIDTNTNPHAVTHIYVTALNTTTGTVSGSTGTSFVINGVTYYGNMGVDGDIATIWWNGFNTVRAYNISVVTANAKIAAAKAAIDLGAVTANAGTLGNVGENGIPTTWTVGTNNQAVYDAVLAYAKSLVADQRTLTITLNTVTVPTASGTSFTFSFTISSSVPTSTPATASFVTTLTVTV